MTFYSWNVNGIGALLQKQIDFSPKSVYPLRSFLKDHDWPHMLCLQEVKINRDDDSMVSKSQELELLICLGLHNRIDAEG